MKTRQMLFVVALTLLITFGMVMIDNAAAAEKPKGTQISNSQPTESLVDSTQLQQLDTTTSATGSNSPLAKFDAVLDYGTVNGYFWSYYESLDTGAAGAVPDTTADTVTTEIWTAAEGGIPSKKIWTATVVNFHTLANVVNGDYQFFDITDSARYDYTYMVIITTLSDSTFVQARAAANINWRHNWRFFAR